MNDNELALAAGNGNRDAFAQLLDRHYDTIFRVAFRYVRSREWAQDIAQDVCVALPKKLGTFRAKSEFSTWLYRVCVNTSLDALRSERAQNQRASGFAATQELVRADSVETKSRLDWLYATLLKIKEPYRGTALLILGEDLTHKQAGEILDVSESTVSWRMMELRKMLKEQVGEDA